MTSDAVAKLVARLRGALYIAYKDGSTADAAIVADLLEALGDECELIYEWQVRDSVRTPPIHVAARARRRAIEKEIENAK